MTDGKRAAEGTAHTARSPLQRAAPKGAHGKTRNGGQYENPN